MKKNKQNKTAPDLNKDTNEVLNNDEGRNLNTQEIDNTQTAHIEYEKDLESKINELETKLRQEQELRLRALADYQNLERRVQNDKQRILSLSKVQIIEALLPFVDDFDRAIEHMKTDESIRDYYNGLSSVALRLTQTFNQFGIYEIECKIGDKFDSYKHEAVGIVKQNDEKLDNTIVQVVAKGYELRLSEENLIIRNVRVIVGKANSS